LGGALHSKCPVTYKIYCNSPVNEHISYSSYFKFIFHQLIFLHYFLQKRHGYTLLLSGLLLLSVIKNEECALGLGPLRGSRELIPILGLSAGEGKPN